MGKKRNIGLSLTVGALIVILGSIAWFLTGIFEGEKPHVSVEPLPEFLSAGERFAISASDMKRGLKIVRVSLNQEGREITVLEEKFPFTGLLNREGVHKFSKEFPIDPSQLNLAQGRVDMQVQARDYSRRSGGDGNFTLVEHKMMVDTIPPAIRA